MRKKTRQRLRFLLDEVFSQLVRERANWTCEHSGRYFAEGERQGLHCSHLFSRRHLATRWHPDNAFAHSYRSHQELGGNPVLFARWASERLGDGRIQMMEERYRSVRKYTPRDLEEMLEHYTQELRAMRGKRAVGCPDRIEFMAFD